MIFVREAQRSRRSGNAYTFVAARWDGRGDRLGKTQFCARRTRAKADPFRHAHDEIDDCFHWFARIRDSALGRVLSLALLSSMGICLLLLSCQLCDRRLRRCRSSVDVADLRSRGKHHRCADVRVVGEFPVRHREQAGRPRGAGLRPSRQQYTSHQPWNQDSPSDLAV
jgi:hypothetical protein